nr:hypothetical protein Iba_chr12cCG6430 [Ipomoea batatas]
MMRSAIGNDDRCGGGEGADGLPPYSTLSTIGGGGLCTAVAFSLLRLTMVEADEKSVVAIVDDDRRPSLFYCSRRFLLICRFHPCRSPSSRLSILIR